MPPHFLENLPLGVTEMCFAGLSFPGVPFKVFCSFLSLRYLYVTDFEVDGGSLSNLPEGLENLVLDCCAIKDNEAVITIKERCTVRLFDCY